MKSGGAPSQQLPVWGHKKNLWRLPGGVLVLEGCGLLIFLLTFWWFGMFFLFFDEDEGLKLSNIHECFAVK